MLSSLVLPVTEKQGRKCGAPRLRIENVKRDKAAWMAGNSMSVPCVAAILTVAILALECKE